jgi:hypothetical protein
VLEAGELLTEELEEGAAERPELPAEVIEEGELEPEEEPEFPAKAVKKGLELVEGLALPTEEPAGKIGEEKLFLSKEREKPLLPRDRREL